MPFLCAGFAAADQIADNFIDLQKESPPDRRNHSRFYSSLSAAITCSPGAVRR